MKKRISKNIFHSLNLIIELKSEKQKKIFWNLFCLKPISKTKINIFNFIFWFQIKKRISKSFFFFQFWLWNWKMKNEKFSKFVLFLNQKTSHTFGTRIRIQWFFYFRSNWALKFKFEVCFSCFILIWKTENQICLNKYLMKQVTISPYVITRNKYKRIN